MNKLYLRPLNKEDTSFLYTLLNNKEVMKYWFVEPYYSIEKIDKMIERHVDDHENRHFIIECDGERVGYIALFMIELIHQKAEFAIMLDPKQQGKGYAKQATHLAIDYAFRVLNLRKLYLIVDSTNERAVHIYRQVGFMQEAILKEEYFVDGEIHDAIYMSMFQKDYLSV